MNLVRVIELLIVFFICVSSVYASGEPLAGGACEYERYEGHAKIISITPHKKQSNYSHELYSVKFSFASDQQGKKELARMERKEFVLLLNNSTYPGPKFLEKYDIRVGKAFKCYLKVIVRGTCTPVTFDFPTIKLDDYFEN